MVMMKKSILGLNENCVGALSYVGLFFTGIAALIMEKENKFVRFHALQSTLWFVFLSVLGWALRILAGIPLLGLAFGLVAGLIGFVTFASMVFLAVMAYKGSTFKIPLIGEVVWNQINK